MVKRYILSDDSIAGGNLGLYKTKEDLDKALKHYEQVFGGAWIPCYDILTGWKAIRAIILAATGMQHKIP